MTDLNNRIESIIGTRPQRISPLHGGMIGEVYRVDFADGERIVAKVAPATGATLSTEGDMLRYLRDNSSLPVPEVLHSEPSLLLMSFIEGSSNLTAPVQTHAAELLAELHQITAPKFGFERDTLIAILHQPNPQKESWIGFFREHRLMYMAREAMNNGPLPSSMFSRIEKLAAQLEKYLQEPNAPSLIHGDMWTTNVLAHDGRVTGFVDPAIYYAHAEIELAFSTLFGTFGEPFFRRYHEIRPIAPGFMEVRRNIYNLYPLLVHVRLFGGGYLHSVDTLLRRFGF